MDPQGDEQRGGAPAPSVSGEPRDEKRRRHRHRRRLYVGVILGAVALAVLVGLIVSNTRQVEVSWVFGSGTVSLVWLVLAVAIVAYFLGMLTSVAFRRRTRPRTGTRGRT